MVLGGGAIFYERGTRINLKHCPGLCKKAEEARDRDRLRPFDSPAMSVVFLRHLSLSLSLSLSHTHTHTHDSLSHTLTLSRARSLSHTHVNVRLGRELVEVEETSTLRLSSHVRGILPNNFIFST